MPRSISLVACILIMLLTGLALHKYYFSVVTVSTPNGIRKTIQLSDGTRVQLNATTVLTFPKDFSSESRKVELDGEAFFHVQPGENPFIVVTNHARIEVIGTSFNIRNRNWKTTVAVERGEVIFENLKHPGKVVLKGGEFSKTEKENKPTKPQEIDIERFFAWREGELVFERMPIPEVFEELERHFDVPIHLKLSGYENQTYTATFSKDFPVTEVLNKICLAFDWKLESIDGSFHISHKGVRR